MSSKKMKERIMVMFIIMGLIFMNILNPMTAYASENNEKEVKTNRFIVKYKNGKKKGYRLQSARKEMTIKDLSIIETEKNMTRDDFQKKLEEKDLMDEVEYIQPDYKLTLTSDDPYYNSQWSIKDNTVTGNVYKESNNTNKDNIFSIKASSAWSKSTGDNILVGVIDTGIDTNHEDLKDNIWTNKNEIPDNGIDDDNNGYVDDINGWNFSDNNNLVHNKSSNHDHGTHIAGIIGAKKDNKKGITGVAPNSKIMALKVFKNNEAYTSDIISAIQYAEKMGAKIVNCSWGDINDNPALKETMKKSNMLFVCAAGNSGVNINSSPVYPAAFNLDNVITVGAMNKSGHLYKNSNYGENKVHVVAPGEDIISTLPNNKYGNKNGTSMAAAFVSGEGALLLSAYENIGAKEIKDRIIGSSDRLSSLEGKIYRGNKINCKNGVDGLISNEIIQVDGGNPTVTDTVYSSVYGGGFKTFADSNWAHVNETTSSIISVPKGNVRGGLSNIVVSGKTITNLKGDGTSELTLTTSSKTHKVDLSTICIDGHEYFLAAEGDNSNIQLRWQDTAGINLGFSDGKYRRKGIIQTYSSVATNQYFGFYDLALTGKIKNILLIDLTELGEEERDVNTLLSKYHYMSFTKSATREMRIKSIGKNLFDVNNFAKLESTHYSINANGDLVVNNIDSRNPGDKFSYSIKLKPNKTYTLSTGKSTGLRVYNKTKTLFAGNGIKTTFTVDQDSIINLKFVELTGYPVVIPNIQLEEGTQATLYEPYKESITYVKAPYNLHSFLNDIKDEIKDEKLYKRIKKLDIGVPNFSNTGTVNIDLHRFTVDRISTVKTNDFILDGHKFTYDPIDADNESKYWTYRDSLNQIYVRVPKGYSFNMYMLNYQLAQPKTIKLNTSPIIAYPNGTLIIDHGVKNTGIYTSGKIKVENKELPINILENVHKISGNAKIPVPMNKVHISPDRLSFKIDGATNGELYEFVYLYDSSLGTLPSVEFSVPMNKEAQVDGNTDMIQTLIEKIETLESKINTMGSSVSNSSGTIDYTYDDNGRLTARKVTY
ncbi:MAG: S8 family serine peptidase [Anaeromicrobium sp.]|jgi:subtilisin family serine protease|uniref:S8 family peptidase n=1 Tax=Anaeromicrobium sp. TaxID=1929132 RepID=UPI0025D88E82|nr:S8 family peptidase [Anaeromicrobium sp.]MCT4595709.1 S8 family serine peptidase [Anaeromicrobium sp.]